VPKKEFTKKLVPGNVQRAMKDAKGNLGEIWKLEPSAIKEIPNFNPRIKNDEYHRNIRAIADSIKNEGFYPDKPLAGYVAHESGKDQIYVTEGHCRLAASRLAISEGAPLREIPVAVVPMGTNMEDLTVALVQGNSGKAFSAYETAIICKRLATAGWSEEEIVERLPYSKVYVARLLRVMAAPAELRQLIEDDLVSLDFVFKALQAHGDGALDAVHRALERAQSRGDEKVSVKHLAAKAFTKSAAQVSPKMFLALHHVRSDPGFAGLSPANRRTINKLMEKLLATDGAPEFLGTSTGSES
jgi:ParB family chromosome partitioning protein